MELTNDVPMCIARLATAQQLCRKRRAYCAGLFYYNFFRTYRQTQTAIPNSITMPTATPRDTPIPIIIRMPAKTAHIDI